jgi:8-oxo-dGTP diphosphatase
MDELSRYDPTKYERPALAVDVVVLTVRHDELQVLVVERAREPYKGQLALPGTFVRKDPDRARFERLIMAAARAMEQKAGLVSHLEQLETFDTEGRDPRTDVVTVAYLSFGPNLSDPVAGLNVASARWVAVSEIQLSDEEIDRNVTRLAFDHDLILWTGLERARSKLEYTTLATRFLPKEFSVADLLRVYEAVWGRSLDAGNFYRKVKSSTGFVTDTGKRNGAARLLTAGPARMLYPPIRREERA